MRKRATATEARIVELEATNAELAQERDAFAQERDSFARQRDALVTELATTHERAVAAERERDLLRASHERLRQELELLKKRLYVAKAERVDTTQLEMEFAAKLRELEELAGTLEMREEKTREKSPRSKPKGRRDLRTLGLPEDRVEIPDPVYEALVAEGKAVRHGFEESSRLMRQRGGMRVVVTARVKYKRFDEEQGKTIVATAARPKDLLDGTIMTASLGAHIIHQKVGQGMPLFRLEDTFAREGVPLDRSTMSRMMEAIGATFGATVVYAMRLDAMVNAFCIATDATGLKVLPKPRADKKRQACKSGHFLVLIADRDHVFFDYLERETSAAIAASFEGFTGYVQADAKSVYDILYRPPPDDADDSVEVCAEVGCWAHARRKFWEATAVAKSEVAKEGLARIGRFFELEHTWRSAPIGERQRRRQAHLRIHVEDFFRWCKDELGKTPERGLLRTALNYAVRQEGALTRFLDDGRLYLDNNRSERALRKVAVGRKAWLFVGSDGHAESLSHLFTLDASARLHGLDPEAYFRDLLRVLPYWPRDRYLELSPRDWARTRATLDRAELVPEVGSITVPPVASR
jgi:transposase